MNSQAPNTRRWSLLGIIGLISMALLAFFLIWFYFVLEWRTEYSDTGFSPRAQRFPFLAAEGYLLRFGIESEQRNSLGLISSLGEAESIISTDDTIILIESYGVIYDERYSRLLGWVEGGGHLIVSTRNQFFGEDLYIEDMLFSYFGIEVYERPGSDFYDYSAYSDQTGTLFTDYSALESSSPENTESSEDAESEQIAGFQAFAEALVVTTDSSKENLACYEDSVISVANSDQLDNELEYQFQGRYFLDTTSPSTIEIASDKRGAQMVALDHGWGNIILSTDNQLWNNYRIGCYDNANLLASLTSSRSKVWFLTNRSSASIVALLWEHFGLSLALLIFGFCIWLWRQSVRFGPILDSEDKRRRSLLEHTDASARFFQTQDRRDVLIDALQNELQRLGERRWRGFKNVSKARQSEILQEMSQCSLETAELALRECEILSEQDFVEQVKACQKIRARL